MMRSKLLILLALVVSAAAHGVVLWGADLAYRHGREQRAGHEAYRRAAERPLHVRLTPPPPPPPMRLGGRSGVHEAIDAVDAPREMRARQAEQDQPAFSRDPVAHGKPIDARPQSTAAHAGSPPRTAVAEAEAASRGAAAPPPVPWAPDSSPAGRTQSPTAAATAERTAPPARPAAAASEASESSAASAAGDPKPQADKEVDAFRTAGSAVFENGRLRVQFGRRFRATAPRLTIAGEMALRMSVRPSLLLKVSTDAAGNVTDVQIIRGTGFTELDQPVLVSMYDWWFEPPLDAAGNPMPDVFLFPVGFR